MGPRPRADGTMTCFWLFRLISLSSLAAHQSFRRPQCVLTGRAPVAGVHKACH